jgi:hypothetical protein
MLALLFRELRNKNAASGPFQTYRDVRHVVAIGYPAMTTEP